MTAVAVPRAPFAVPAALEATVPAERRGLRRDGVRLLVATPGGMEHHVFADLPSILSPGDVVVVNTSATLAAALDGRRADGRPAIVHVAGQLDCGEWVVEVRRLDNSGPDLAVGAGTVVSVRGDALITLVGPYPVADAVTSRLWRATMTPPVTTVAYLRLHGRPIRYGYQATAYPLDDYQNVYAAEPGSAEMASAGRPFTAELLVRLMAAGVTVAPVVLHAGVSSPELHEAPAPERFAVPPATARLVAAARAGGGRVVAVGTTVVRALESAALADGHVSARSGWTDLVLGPGRPARVVTGLLTGLHLPESSHLQLLSAVAGPALVDQAYDAALAHGYLWHEFGDSMLFVR